MPNGAFTCFDNLPLELRLLIWEEALSASAVFAVSLLPAPASGSRVNDLSRPLSIGFVGPAPYLAGLSCREARHVMKKTCFPLTGPRRNTWTTESSGVVWLNLDKTVIYLGDMSELLDILPVFKSGEAAKFKHVAMTWFRRLFNGGSPFPARCVETARLCPALHTMTILLRPAFSSITGLPDEDDTSPLKPDHATSLIDVTTYSGPELDVEGQETEYFRSLLSVYVRTSLRLHFLHLDAAGRSTRWVAEYQ